MVLEVIMSIIVKRWFDSALKRDVLKPFDWTPWDVKASHKAGTIACFFVFMLFRFYEGMSQMRLIFLQLIDKLFKCLRTTSF